MTDSNHLTRIKVFVSSPGDVEAEREAVRKVARGLNERLAIPKGVLLDVLEWKDRVIPYIGARPQEIINEQIEPCEVFIGIMWSRFGTPTARFGSGTEEEFRLAYERFRGEGSPKILFYFCGTPPALTSSNLEQYAKVLKFKEDLSAENLISQYNKAEEFEDLVRDHLTQYLAELPTSNVQPPLKRGEIRFADPNSYGIFIASARDMLEPKCHLLAQELRRQEFEVYHPAPGEVVTDLISRAKVCVHLLDGVADSAVDDQLDLSCSLAHWQILSVPKKVLLANDSPDPYLRKLKGITTREGRFEFMQPGGDPVHDIVERLVELRDRWLQSKETLEKKGRCIFFNIQQRDIPDAATLFDYLKDNDIEALTNREDPDEPTMKEFDEKVSKSQAFVVFYGASVDRGWVRSRLNSAVQLVFQKSCKVKKLAVYLAPPPRGGLDPIELPLHFKPLWIDHTEGFNPSKLQDLVSVFGPLGPEVTVWPKL